MKSSFSLCWRCYSNNNLCCGLKEDDSSRWRINSRTALFQSEAQGKRAVNSKSKCTQVHSRVQSTLATCKQGASSSGTNRGKIESANYRRNSQKRLLRFPAEKKAVNELCAGIDGMSGSLKKEKEKRTGIFFLLSTTAVSPILFLYTTYRV